MEVYNEEINDLLGVPGPTSKNLRIVSEDAVRGAVIGGLVEEVCVTPNDFMEVLHRGEASRSYASTSMNAESSRSHTIYRVSIDVRHVDNDGSNDVSAVRTSYMNLVDLAGSERQKSTNATGKTLKEGSNINKSLLALGAVINKLGEASKKVKGAKPVFIPYRDSKLTRILKLLEVF
jgi:centromeric protein E